MKLLEWFNNQGNQQFIMHDAVISAAYGLHVAKILLHYTVI